MMKWVFIGDVMIPDYGITPLAVPTDRKIVLLSDARRMGEEAGSVGGLAVRDEESVYHRVFSSLAVLADGGWRSVSVDELVRGARPHSGDICSLIREVGVAEVRVSDSPAEPEVEVFSILPLIVVYSDKVWENVSLAPIKHTSGDFMISSEFGVGLIIVRDRCLTFRPFMSKILSNPTSVIIARECGLKLVRKESLQSRSPRRPASILDFRGGRR